MRMPSHRPISSAFTMVELLVVVAIIAILAALIMPATRTIREAGRSAGCLGNMRQIGMANIAYSQEWNGRILPSFSKYTGTGATDGGGGVTYLLWDALVASYMDDATGILKCPADYLDPLSIQKSMSGTWVKGVRSYAMVNVHQMYYPTDTHFNKETFETISLSKISRPGEAGFFTERINGANYMFCLWSNAAGSTGDLRYVHRGMDAWLFFDGHAGLFPPAKTIGKGLLGSAGFQARGFWTITPDD